MKRARASSALFSTVNLHIFQTYYGGLRPSADMSSWIYGDYDLVKQFIEGGRGHAQAVARSAGLHLR